MVNLIIKWFDLIKEYIKHKNTYLSDEYPLWYMDKQWTKFIKTYCQYNANNQLCNHLIKLSSEVKLIDAYLKFDLL